MYFKWNQHNPLPAPFMRIEYHTFAQKRSTRKIRVPPFFQRENIILSQSVLFLPSTDFIFV
ncbi:hypothetical protein BRYFOR_06916 [Marvinbryantia formatexigens DSM 14469]|uniref:Uncharacterized protein n=1 Tax=Marvinbryantia formatexigens DSM 14469 TaxID=478749 RepID=C6LE67_9FIRM|nr:hypothetical protein BRYFOR_06916 [Marvinbryantia formatexigens DSM 14469]